MKSKKLFAILTLVAFMMTLLPMAAFAAPYSASGTLITVDMTSVAASENGADRPIKVTLIARDSTGAALNGQVLSGGVYIKSDNDAVKVGLAKDNAVAIGAGGLMSDLGALTTATKVYNVTSLTTAAGAYVPIKTDANGRVYFYVYSRIASNATLKFYNSRANYDGKVLLGEKALSFTSTGTTIRAIDFRSVSTFAATAGSKVELIAKVYDGSNNGVSGQDVEWFVKKGSTGSYTSLGIIKSDDLGDAKYTVYPTEATSYQYKVKVSDKTYEATKNVVVSAAAPVKIEAKDAVKYAETNKDFYANFFAYDTFGNKVTNSNGGVDIVWNVTAKPTNSGVQKDSSSPFSNFRYDTVDKYVYAKFKPDIAGEFTVKASIPATGVSTTMKVNAGTFGTISSVKVQLPKIADGKRAIGIKTSNLAVGASRWDGKGFKDLAISLVDANGVEKDAAETDVILSTSNQDLLKISTGTGYVWNRVYAPVNNSKGTATITVTHKSTGKSGSLEIPVIGGPSTIAETVAVSDKTATVTLQLKDSDGKNTFDSEANHTDFEVFTSGATVDSKKQFARITGIASFTLTSSDYTAKDVTVVMNGGLSKTFKVDFAAPAPVVEGAAKNVTMFIGSKGFTKDGAAAVCEVSPFIKDSRTFVELRAVASAFGVKAEDIAFANGVITLKRSDVTVTITLGSKDITTSAGKTITMDVAAYVTAENRTVLPIKFIGDAFGYTATYDGTTQSVSFVRA